MFRQNQECSLKIVSGLVQLLLVRTLRQLFQYNRLQVELLQLKFNSQYLQLIVDKHFIRKPYFPVISASSYVLFPLILTHLHFIGIGTKDVKSCASAIKLLAIYAQLMIGFKLNEQLKAPQTYASFLFSTFGILSFWNT